MSPCSQVFRSSLIKNRVVIQLLYLQPDKKTKTKRVLKGAFRSLRFWLTGINYTDADFIIWNCFGVFVFFHIMSIQNCHSVFIKQRILNGMLYTDYFMRINLFMSEKYFLHRAATVITTLSVPGILCFHI